MQNTPYYQDVVIGCELPPLVKYPSNVQLFRYSAVTWNSHRIHYDPKYAVQEGYPDVLVQSHLHGAFLTQLCTDWMGLKGVLVSIVVNAKRFAVPGDTLTCKGKIVEKRIENNKGLVTLELVEVNQRGEICMPGKAVIRLPLRPAVNLT